MSIFLLAQLCLIYNSFTEVFLISIILIFNNYISFIYPFSLPFIPDSLLLLLCSTPWRTPVPGILGNKMCCFCWLTVSASSYIHRSLWALCLLTCVDSASQWWRKPNPPRIYFTLLVGRYEQCWGLAILKHLTPLWKVLHRSGEPEWPSTSSAYWLKAQCPESQALGRPSTPLHPSMYLCSS